MELWGFGRATRAAGPWTSVPRRNSKGV